MKETPSSKDEDMKWKEKDRGQWHQRSSDTQTHIVFTSAENIDWHLQQIGYLALCYWLQYYEKTLSELLLIIHYMYPINRDYPSLIKHLESCLMQYNTLLTYIQSIICSVYFLALLSYSFELSWKELLLSQDPISLIYLLLLFYFISFSFMYIVFRYLHNQFIGKWI